MFIVYFLTYIYTYIYIYKQKRKVGKEKCSTPPQQRKYTTKKNIKQ